MARKINNLERGEKMVQARELYLQGMDTQFIAKATGMATRTVNKWVKDNDWENQKQLHNVSVAELKMTILQIFDDLKNGRTPKMTPDQVSKLAAAYEKLSDKQRYLGYAYEVFGEFSAFMGEDVQRGKTKTEKERRMASYQYMRKLMQQFTEAKYREVFKND